MVGRRFSAVQTDFSRPAECGDDLLMILSLSLTMPADFVRSCKGVLCHVKKNTVRTLCLAVVAHSLVSCVGTIVMHDVCPNTVPIITICKPRRARQLVSRCVCGAVAHLLLLSP